MRDPHVDSLTYKMEIVSDESYVDPPPLDGNEPEFSYRLADELLTVKLTKHFATEEEARSVVEVFLRTWELGPALSEGKKRIWFVFKEAEIIDRQPRKPGEPQRISVGTGEFLIFGGVMNAYITRKKYPEPPTGIIASSDVLTMWFRYEMFKSGKEPLAAMAYFCLTVLEGSTGKKVGVRKAVCLMYCIDQDVRDTFGDLVSERGDETTARKFDADATRIPFRGNEEKWLEQVVLALIRRKAEYDFNPSGVLRQLSMTDFVKLTIT